MGLGGTAKKVQKLADVAEDTYKRINELKSQLQAMRTTVEDTSDRVRSLERELDRQRALIEALAETQGVDPDAVLEDVDATADGGSDTSEDAGRDAPASDH